MKCNAQLLPTFKTMHDLTLIWQRVLQQPSITLDGDFFELGGSPALAAQLFVEIGTTFGRDLPPEFIYQARTIRSLAPLLELSTKPRLNRLVVLQEGTAQQPIFIAPGLGGSPLDFFHVVKHIELTNPIYGMQAKGMDGQDEPLERIEDMADCYLAAVREVQSRGPYFLVGYSLGGLVMLEMAQRLLAGGERVALLVMVDSYPDRRHLSLGQRLRLTIRIARQHAYRQPVPGGLTPHMQHVRQSAYRALNRYRPRFYADKIKFVRARIVSRFPDDPAAVWGKLVRGLEVETVPGDHQGMLKEHFESLASVLARFVRERSAVGE
jgi:acetoacetyl-CoA synthetase